MQNIELITITAVIILASTLAYRSSFLHNKKIGHISILQIFYLVLAPGFLYTIIFSYILDILQRPLNTHVFLNDKLLTSFLLLSILYTYGGLAIHGISKTIWSYFDKKQKQSLAYKVNEYFHMEFSHNLIFIGGLISAACFALLELNHISPYPKQGKLLIIISNGIFVGLASIIGGFGSYYRYRRSELKLFFFSFWAIAVVILYAVKPYIKNVRAYPFTLTMLIAFSILAALNIFLYIKKVKNKIKLIWKMPKDLL